MAWKEQYHRMERWHTRVWGASAQQEHYENPDRTLDDVYGFFQNCYHLKDWIKNDDTLPQETRRSIVTAVEDSRPLTLCKDICNASKHLRFDRNASIRRKPSFIRQQWATVTSFGQKPKPLYRVACEVETDQGTESAYTLALMCAVSWRMILVKHGLLDEDNLDFEGEEITAK